ncbi:MAG TPA: hypothetical protein VGF25_17155 [Thermoleophilaceae bacterium]
MTLELDEFGLATLEAEARRHSLSPDQLVGHAARYYLADRGSGRPAHRVPRFPRRRNESTVDVDLDLEGGTWRELDEESERQGVPVERLLEHAALYLIADLDSGRVAGKLVSSTDDPDD